MSRYLDVLDEGGVPIGRRVLSALGPRMLAMAAERSGGIHPYLTVPSRTTQEREALGPEALVAPEQTVVLDTHLAAAARAHLDAGADHVCLQVLPADRDPRDRRPSTGRSEPGRRRGDGTGGVTGESQAGPRGRGQDWGTAGPRPVVITPDPGGADRGRRPRTSAAADGDTMVRSTRMAPMPAPSTALSVDPMEISGQALSLHALGLVTTAMSERDGRIGRAEAEELAARCGALVSELVDVGLWIETDLCYVVRSGIVLRFRANAASSEAP